MAYKDEHDHDHDDLHEEPEAVSLYCVRCRETVEVDDPVPVWTRKGLPATRGTCPICGSTAYRLGKSAAHQQMSKPNAVRVATNTSAELVQQAIYINFAPEDVIIARQIAHDLERIGLACWLHEIAPPDVQWAGNVHPALKECVKMVLVLSPAAHHEPSMAEAWGYFSEKKKPVVVAQVASAAPPDVLRRRPRYDFSGDYKSAFRQMVQALSE
ncbi:MAG: DUF5679 domain-containing protein [Chloroflexota bacterium]|nr:DUF5679 domain-containing protein [Chloroflexota bacterium]